MKIGIITDTNMIKINESELALNGIFNNIDFYLDYIDDLNNTRSRNKLVYFMPKVVLEELISQKRDTFLDQYNSFITKYDALEYALIGEKPQNNIDEYIKNERIKYESKMNLLNIPYSVKTFKKLVNDSLKKNPPFDKSKEGKKTDAGFKDALIWSTILESKELDDINKLYFFTGDKVFNDNKLDLEKEFNSYHTNTDFELVYLEPKGDHRQQSLQLIIKNHSLKESDVIKLYNESMNLYNLIKMGKYRVKENITYMEETIVYKLDEILFESFNLDDFIIKNVKKNDDNNYEVFIEFKTKKYILDKSQANNRDLYGTIIINYQKKSNTFIAEGIKIDSLYFELSNVEAIIALNSGISKIIQNFHDPMSNLVKTITEALSSYNDPVNNLSKNITEALSSYNNLTKPIVKTINESIPSAFTKDKNN